MPQVINRAGDGVPFSEEDEEEAAAFADHAALILDRVMQAEVQVWLEGRLGRLVWVVLVVVVIANGCQSPGLVGSLQRRRLRHEAEVLRAAIAEHALLPTSLLGLDPSLTPISRSVSRQPCTPIRFREKHVAL